MPWLAISPAEGEVSGDSLGALSLRLDATLLEAGFYIATLTLVSNDLLSPVFHIPVTIIVNPYPAHLPAVSRAGTPDMLWGAGQIAPR